MTMVERARFYTTRQQLGGVLFTDMDAKVNKWLGSVAGLPINATSATSLRCELGVLPSQLVAERNTFYYLWQLRNEAWYRQFLPSLQHLSPVARLTSILIDNNITLEESHSCVDPGQASGTPWSRRRCSSGRKGGTTRQGFSHDYLIVVLSTEANRTCEMTSLLTWLVPRYNLEPTAFRESPTPGNTTRAHCAILREALMGLT